MKKAGLMLVFVLEAVVLRGHSSGEDVAVPDPNVSPERAYFVLQRSPRSVSGEAGFHAHTALDDFVDVTGWRNVDFDRVFFFAGGGGGSESAAFRGGGAGRIGANYLGVYFSGDVFSGRGGAVDKDSPSFEEAVNMSYDELAVNDNLIVLFGNGLLGGFRLDLCFDQTKFTSLTAKNGNLETSSTPFVTTLQWGRRFGNFSPKASVGVSWGGYGTEDEFDYPRLAFKAEAEYGSFSADYQLSLAMDDTVTIDGKDYVTNGGADHLANLYWTARTALTETLELAARPQLQFDLYSCENTAEGSGETIRNGALFYFGFAPILEASLRWQLVPRLSLMTGVRFTLLRYETKTREKGNVWADDTGSAWSVSWVEATGGSVAFEWSPSEQFALEAGIDGFFDFNTSGYAAHLTNLTGGFAFVFRL